MVCCFGFRREKSPKVIRQHPRRPAPVFETPYLRASVRESTSEQISRQQRKQDSHLGANSDAPQLRSLRKMSPDRLGRVLVEVDKQDSVQLGLTVSGGADRDEIPVISCVRSGSIADRSDCLLVNDHIIAVNGISTAMLKHEEISSLVKNAEKKLLLEIEYELPDFPTVNSISTLSKRIEVILDKDGNSYGFTVRGGCCRDNPMRSRPLTVMHVRPGSSADRDGRIKVGDRILAINGINMASVSCEEAMTILRLSEFEAVMLVEYDVAIVDVVHQERRPLIIEIDKQPNETLGVTLAPVTVDGRDTLCIDNIREASIADRCGALHVGDQILSIDGTSVGHITVQEATQLLRNNVTTMVRLELVPSLRRMSITQTSGPGSPLQQQQTLINPKEQDGKLMTSSSLRYIVPSGAVGEPSAGAGEDADAQDSPITRPRPYQSLAADLDKEVAAANSREWREPSLARSQASIYQTMSRGGLAVCHLEVTALELRADDKGTFGFTFQGVDNPTQPLLSPPVIEYIEPGGTADRIGILQEGDRVLAINDQPVFNRSMDSINSQLLSSDGHCRLEVEFDVADAVVPSSGIFTVKLAKKGAALGITLNSSHHPLLISGITVGSVAYRSGTLQPGDRLLAINENDITRCSLEEAAALLQDCDTVVRIKVLKAELPPGILHPDLHAYTSPSTQRQTAQKSILHQNSQDQQKHLLVAQQLADLQEASMMSSEATGQLPPMECFTVELKRQQPRSPLGLCLTESDSGSVILGRLTPNSLAATNGRLMAGDTLLAVNKQRVVNSGVEDVLRMLGQSGCNVQLTVARRKNIHSVQAQIECPNSCLPEEEDSGAGGGAASSGGGSNGGSSGRGPPPQPPLRGSIHTKIPSKDSAVDMEPVTTESDSGSASPLLPVRPARITSFDPRVRVIDEECPGCREAAAAEAERRAAQYYAQQQQKQQQELHRQRSNERQNFRLRQSRSDTQLRHGTTSPASTTSSGSGSQVSTSTTIHNVTLYKFEDGDTFGLAFASGRQQDQVQNGVSTFSRRLGSNVPASSSPAASSSTSGTAVAGVYVSELRPGGPAAKSGQIRVCDRLLKVAGHDTRSACCEEVVRLIETAGNTLTLTLARRKGQKEVMTQETRQPLRSQLSINDDDVTHRKVLEINN